MLRTYQPKKRHRKKEHGFRKRMATKNGRKVLARRRAKGRKQLTYWFWKRMDKYESIKLNKDFRYLYARGQSFVSPHIVVYFKKNKLDHNRLGITTGKKIGKAVKRNRARRLIRVAFRTLQPQLKETYDFVIVARTRCVFAGASQVTNDLKHCFIQAGILKDENNS